MPTQIQLRKGTTAQTSSFIGASAEITVDTSKNTIVVHDGITAGGYPLALDLKAQAAFDAANAAGSNVVVTLAFDQANSAYNQANTSTNNAASAGVYANTGIDLAQSAYHQGNSTATIANTAVNDAASASLYANTGIADAASASLYANTGINNTASASAYANAGINLAQAAYHQGNSTAIVANTGINNAAGASLYANTGINLAQSAYNQGNSTAIIANTKFDSSGGTISGDVIISGNNDLTITGNLYVQGNTVTTNTQSFVVADPVILLASGNFFNDAKDIGFAAHYNAGTNAHTGFIRDYVTKEYYIFDNYTPELDANNEININDASFRTANVNAGFFKGNLIGTSALVNGYEYSTYVPAAYAQANTATNNAASASLYANTGITLAQAAYNQSNSTATVANTDYTTLSVTPATYGNATSIPSITLTANGRISSITNTAISIPAATTITNNNTINATYYPLLSSATSGTLLTANTANTKLSFNPSTGNLVTTLITADGSNLTGYASDFTVFYAIMAGSTDTSANFQMNSVGVGTAASGVVGEIRATNNITAFYSSDIKFKENVQTIPDALSKVECIGGKTFDWTYEYIKDHGGEDGYFVQKEDFGVIAQDVQTVFPQAVRTRPDGSLAVDYSKLAALAFAAIVELSEKVKKLELK
jgi:hypothetical protein